MASAAINGVVVTGTPQEIAEIIQILGGKVVSGSGTDTVGVVVHRGVASHDE